MPQSRSLASILFKLGWLSRIERLLSESRVERSGEYAKCFVHHPERSGAVRSLCRPDIGILQRSSGLGGQPYSHHMSVTSVELVRGALRLPTSSEGPLDDKDIWKALRQVYGRNLHSNRQEAEERTAIPSRSGWPVRTIATSVSRETKIESPCCHQRDQTT